jgi:hypothetical protein
MAWEKEYISYTVSNLAQEVPGDLQIFSLAERR